MDSRCGIEQPRNEHEATPNGSMIDLLRGQVGGDGIVRPVEQDNMH